MAGKAGLILNRSRQVPAEDTPAFGGIAERFRRAGDLERSIALCREGLRKFPTLLSARVTLGWALLDKGDYAEARTELEQVLRRAPDNLAAIRGLAELHDRTDHLQSSHHDDEQNIDLASLTAAIEEEERVAAKGAELVQAAARLQVPSGVPPVAFEVGADSGASLMIGEAANDTALTEFEVASAEQDVPAPEGMSSAAAFEVDEIDGAVLTSPSDFAVQASPASTDFYDAAPVELASASESTVAQNVAAPISLETTAVTDETLAPVAFSMDEPAVPAAFELSAELQGLDPVFEVAEPATLSLGPLEHEDSSLSLDAAPALAAEHHDDLVTLPATGELEFDDLSLAIGALGLESASVEPAVVEISPYGELAAAPAVEPDARPAAFDDVAPAVTGMLAPPEMAGAFDHDFGLAAERAETSHDYDLPDGDTSWVPERDAPLAAFSSTYGKESDGLDDEIRAAMPDGKVVAMASHTPTPKFSTAGLERLLRQVQARRVALATSSVA